jgi:hypothetical protein
LYPINNNNSHEPAVYEPHHMQELKQNELWLKERCAGRGYFTGCNQVRAGRGGWRSLSLAHRSLTSIGSNTDTQILAEMHQ